MTFYTTEEALKVNQAWRLKNPDIYKANYEKTNATKKAKRAEAKVEKLKLKLQANIDQINNQIAQLQKPES